MNSDYTPSHSLLVQQSGTGSPSSLSVSNNSVIGKLTGNIVSLSASDIRTLINVEDGADVTDTANVTAAGALMDSEVTNLAAVKAFDPADYATAAQGATADTALQPGDAITTLDGTAHRVLYIDGSGNVTELALGADGTFLKSNGATSAPSFEAPAGSGDMVLATAQQYTAQKGFDAVTLTFDATQDWDLNTSQVAILTLTGNTTFDAPSNQAAGNTYVLILKQDATGGRTAAWNAAFKWAGGTAPTLTTDANAVDIITFVSDGTSMYGVAQLDFS
jgi:hypothetical protein